MPKEPLLQVSPHPLPGLPSTHEARPGHGEVQSPPKCPQTRAPTPAARPRGMCRPLTPVRGSTWGLVAQRVLGQDTALVTDVRQGPTATGHQRGHDTCRLRPDQTPPHRTGPLPHFSLALPVSPSFSLPPQAAALGSQGEKRNSAKAKGAMASPGTPGLAEQPK